MYSWNGVNYSERGKRNLYGEDENDIGAGISFSGNGDVLALAVYGKVYVYSWINSTYAKQGADINGMATNNKYGTSVDQSFDGNIFAVGSPGKGSVNTGCVTVYSWGGTNLSHEVTIPLTVQVLGIIMDIQSHFLVMERC